MPDTRLERRARDLARAFRDRHGRRARALASVLDGDDDEIVIRPWQWRLPRVVVLAAARARGYEPASHHAPVSAGFWLEPMRFTRRGADQ